MMFINFQLMSRPTNLSLVLNEAYPTTRHHSMVPNMNVMEVQDMTQMANFVYSYYMEKVKVMKNYYQVSNLFILCAIYFMACTVVFK